MQLAQTLPGQFLLAMLFNVPGVYSYCRQLRLSTVICPHHAVAPLDVHPLQNGLHRLRLIFQQGLAVTRLEFQVKRGAFDRVDWALRGSRIIHLKLLILENRVLYAYR